MTRIMCPHILVVHDHKFLFRCQPYQNHCYRNNMSSIIFVKQSWCYQHKERHWQWKGKVVVVCVIQTRLSILSSSSLLGRLIHSFIQQPTGADFFSCSIYIWRPFLLTNHTCLSQTPVLCAQCDLSQSPAPCLALCKFCLSPLPVIVSVLKLPGVIDKMLSQLPITVSVLKLPGIIDKGCISYQGSWIKVVSVTYCLCPKAARAHG